MQTLRSQLDSGEEGTVTGKQLPYKKTKSAPPLFKRKPQSGLYASVRSSGYGKPSSPFKTFSNLEKKTSKDIMKSKNLRSILASNQSRKKGNHSIHLVYYFPCSLLSLFPFSFYELSLLIEKKWIVRYYIPFLKDSVLLSSGGFSSLVLCLP